MSKGKIAVISGFSGAGKGTVVRTLMEKYDHYALSVSMTTRSPRDGEVHGREYYFVSHEEFRDAIDKDGFLEYAYYEGSSNNYGTPRAFVEENLNKDRHVILEIEVQGGAQVKAVYPDTVSIFIVPPSAEELVRRLVDRPDQSIDFDTVQKRLRTALRESADIGRYDAMLINDTGKAEECADAIEHIMETGDVSGHAPDLTFVEKFKAELEAIIERREKERN